jgi:hypothetical protein
MKLHFPWPEVAKILDEVRAATVVNPLYGTVTGKGLWLVGDDGVYLMPNTKCEGKPSVVYARECDPTKLGFDEWWSVKRASFGGDDGVEFIGLKEIDGLLIPAKRGAEAMALIVDITPESFTITIQWKSASKKGRAA